MTTKDTYARVYKVLLRFRLRRLARWWWRRSILRLYPDDAVLRFQNLVVPPDLWRDDPVFDWRPDSEKEEG